MRRLRTRSSAFGLPTASFGASGRSVAGGGGGGGEGGSSNHTETQKGAGDRWRMLYYQISVSQYENQTQNIIRTGSLSYKLRNIIKMSGLNPLKWKIRTFAYVSAALLAFGVLFLYKKTHHVSFDAIIQNTEPKAVWEFVSDFNNMKKLNPTIEDFDIVAESGNYDHWKYSAHYTEHLSHVPMIKNRAQSHFAIKSKGDSFVISSEHRTCFLSTLGCLDSVSEFKFSSEGPNTKCVETVQYECPIAFSILCRKEVMYQRHEIMKNLKSHFSMTNIRTNDDK